MARILARRSNSKSWCCGTNFRYSDAPAGTVAILADGSVPVAVISYNLDGMANVTRDHQAGDRIAWH
jgi:hypothetical protein